MTSRDSSGDGGSKRLLRPSMGGRTQSQTLPHTASAAGSPGGGSRAGSSALSSGIGVFEEEMSPYKRTTQNRNSAAVSPAHQFFCLLPSGPPPPLPPRAGEHAAACDGQSDYEAAYKDFQRVISWHVPSSMPETLYRSSPAFYAGGNLTMTATVRGIIWAPCRTCWHASQTLQRAKEARAPSAAAACLQAGIRQ